MLTCSTRVLQRNCSRILYLSVLLLAGCTAAKDSPEVMLERARMHSQRGEFAEAIPLYTKSIIDFPENAEIVFLRGVAYENLNLLDRAQEDYAKCIELDSEYVDAINNYGVVLARLGSYEKAIEQFSRLISINPADALALRNRGLCFHDLGQTQMSIDDYTKAIAVAPEDAQAKFLRGNVYLDEEDFASAEADFTMAIEVDELLAKAWVNRGIARLRQGRRDEAIQDFSKGHELDDNIILPGVDFIEHAETVASAASWNSFLSVSDTKLTESGFQDLKLISADSALGFAIYQGLRERVRVDILAARLQSPQGDSPERQILVPHEFVKPAASDDGMPHSRTLMILQESRTEEPSWNVVDTLMDWQPDEKQVQPYIDRINF